MNQPNAVKALSETIDQLCAHHGVQRYGDDSLDGSYQLYYWDGEKVNDFDINQLNPGFTGFASFYLEVDGSRSIEANILEHPDKKALYEIEIARQGEVKKIPRERIHVDSTLLIDDMIPVQVTSKRIHEANTIAEFQKASDVYDPNKATRVYYQGPTDVILQVLEKRELSEIDRQIIREIREKDIEYISFVATSDGITSSRDNVLMIENGKRQYAYGGKYNIITGLDNRSMGGYACDISHPFRSKDSLKMPGSLGHSGGNIGHIALPIVSDSRFTYEELDSMLPESFSFVSVHAGAIKDTSGGSLSNGPDTPWLKYYHHFQIHNYPEYYSLGTNWISKDLRRVFSGMNTGEISFWTSDPEGYIGNTLVYEEHPSKNWYTQSGQKVDPITRKVITNE